MKVHEGRNSTIQRIEKTLIPQKPREPRGASILWLWLGVLMLCRHFPTSSFQKGQFSAAPGNNGESIAGPRVDAVSVGKIFFEFHADLSPALDKIWAFIIVAIKHLMSPTRVRGRLPCGQLFSTVRTGFIGLFHGDHLPGAYGPTEKLRRVLPMSISIRNPNPLSRCHLPAKTDFRYAPMNPWGNWGHARRVETELPSAVSFLRP